MSLPEYFIFTDIGHDIDDALAFVGPLGRLHKDKKIKIVGIVVQLKPTKERVWLMLGLLAAMGITDIPVAHGPATDERPWKLQPYEFDSGLKALAQKEAKAQNKGGNFLKLAEDRLIKKVDGKPRTDKSVRVLVLTNFQRIMQVMNHVGEGAFKNAVSEIHLQSGLNPEQPGWNMFKDAGNNMQDVDAAEKFFAWSRKHTDISYYIYTNQAALPARFPQQDFYKKIEFEDPSKPKPGNIGLIQKYLRNVHTNQCGLYYNDSNRMIGGKNVPVIENRGRGWYFKTYLPQIYQKQPDGNDEKGNPKWKPKMGNNEEGEELPVYDIEYPYEATDYVKQLYQYAEVIPYDPIVALGSVAQVTGKAPAKKALSNETEKYEVGSNIGFGSKEAEDIKEMVLEYLGKTFA
jgi:hypothetical protein